MFPSMKARARGRSGPALVSGGLHSALAVILALSAAACDAGSTLQPQDVDYQKKSGASAVGGVTISPKPVTLNAIGSSIQLSATAVDGNGRQIKNAGITWTSLDPSIAVVDTRGNVTSRAVGLALITAVSGSAADTARIDVRQIVATVHVTPETASLNVGDSIRMVAVAADSNGVEAPGATIQWASSSSAASVLNGVVKGLTAGTATITAATATASARATIQTGAADPCGAHSYTRLVNVRTAAELSSALSHAQPGDLIRLADGVYQGRFSTDRSGREGRPIVMCGSRAAVIETGSITNRGFALVIQANYWVVDGFTVTNSLQGVRVLRGQHNIVRRLRIHSLGQEAINLKAFSSHNIVEENEIHDTGRTEPRYGEGVYVGTSDSQWCQWTDCQPDRSDSNVVRNNRIGPNIGSDMVDVKAGTTGTLVAGNTFDGRGSRTEQRAWVIVKGNDVVVENNRGTVSPLHGFEVGSEEGWGQRALFKNNYADLAGGSGYGIRIGSGGRETAVVRCDNVVVGASMGLANVACTR
jgi:hypothetical protein